jgi:hypothetical protein
MSAAFFDTDLAFGKLQLERKKNQLGVCFYWIILGNHNPPPYVAEPETDAVRVVILVLKEP